MDPQKAHEVPKTLTTYKTKRLINAEDTVYLSFSFVFREVFFAIEFFI